MVRAILGEPALTPLPFFRLATIGALAVAACVLTGCGRKGPLDPPPGGWDLPQGTSQTPVSNRAAPPPPQEYDAEGKPVAPQGPKRRTPADWLLD